MHCYVHCGHIILSDSQCFCCVFIFLLICIPLSVPSVGSTSSSSVANSEVRGSSSVTSFSCYIHPPMPSSLDIFTSPDPSSLSVARRLLSSSSGVYISGFDKSAFAILCAEFGLPFLATALLAAWMLSQAHWNFGLLPG